MASDPRLAHPGFAIGPPPDGSDRRLLAVLAVDACGYSGWARADEDAALQALDAALERIRIAVADGGGDVCAACGDGLIATFPSARQAVDCALSLQGGVGPGPLRFRVGVHLGDTRRIGGQVLGDSVNVAARIQAVAEPGGVAVSRPVFEAVRGLSRWHFRPLGRPRLKNLGDDLEVLAVDHRRPPAPEPRTGCAHGPEPGARAGTDAGTGAGAGAGAGSDAAAPPAPSPTFAIALMPPQVGPGDDRAVLCAGLLGDWLARSLAEIEAVEVHDYRLTAVGRDSSSAPGSTRRGAGPDLLVFCRSLSAGTTVHLAMVVVRAEDRTVIWSGTVSTDVATVGTEPAGPVGPFVARAADALLSALTDGRNLRDPAAQLAARTTIGAVHHLLTMTGPGLTALEGDLAAAHALDPKPIYLGWLAYMTTFRIGERLGERDRELQDRALSLARAALDADPHNSVVLGLTAHVHSYVLRDFATAEDLLHRARDINPFRAILWDSASLLYSYTGRADRARRAAQRAQRLGRHSPYRHLYDGAACVAAAAGGRFDEAVRYGEGVIAVQPEFKSVLRYLAASHGYLGNTARARALLDRLEQLEPDLSVERLRDESYPVPTPSCEALIETGLSRIGLQRHA